MYYLIFISNYINYVCILVLIHNKMYCCSWSFSVRQGFFFVCQSVIYKGSRARHIMANHNPVLEVTNIKIHRPVSYARNKNCELFSLLINSFPIPVLIGFFVHLCRKSHRIKWTHKWAYNRKSSIIGFAHCLKKSKEMCNELNNSQ